MHGPRGDSTVRAAVVGLRMGAVHVEAISSLDGVTLVGVCDIDGDLARRIAEGRSGSGVRAWADYLTMLRETKPDLVAIATPNRFHCEMTLQAVEAGATAICCEKPIAVDLAQARRMSAACREAGVLLVVNHQRRIGADFAWIRKQVAAGAIGNPYVVRGTCAGDMLSDGTHLVDSILYLAGDRDWAWVFAAHHRDAPAAAGIADRAPGRDGKTGGGFDAVAGWRFGHPVEDGMVTVVEFADGLRAELLTGDFRLPGRPYHDIEVIGSRGALWRRGDAASGNVLRRSPSGAWEAVTGLPGRDGHGLIRESYRLLVELLCRGGSDAGHPLGAPYAMRGFEVVMGAYESARTRTIVRPPVAQERYPLAVELGLEP